MSHSNYTPRLVLVSILNWLNMTSVMNEAVWTSVKLSLLVWLLDKEVYYF